MKSKLCALLVFAIFVSACGSSTPAPEEVTQNETQEIAEVTEEDVQDVSEASTVEGEDDLATAEEGNQAQNSETVEEPQPQLANSQLEEAITASLNAWIEENGAPGTAVSVLLPDGSQVDAAAGSRDRNGTPASVNDYWRIASISKPITSAIVLKLVEQGAIEIDEPVMTYLGAEWAQGYVLSLIHI